MGKDEDGLRAIADAIQRLGNADAATPFGGLEALGIIIKEGDRDIASSISELAVAVEYLANVMAGKAKEE